MCRTYFKRATNVTSMLQALFLFIIECMALGFVNLEKAFDVGTQGDGDGNATVDESTRSGTSDDGLGHVREDKTTARVVVGEGASEGFEVKRLDSDRATC